MAFQTWLADVLRGAGLTVVEVSGWRTRSGAEDKDASTYNPHGIIIHETRGSATSTDAGELDVLINGRAGLTGPIAQLYLSRSGVWYVVTAGLSHHVKTGWAGPFSGQGNTRLLGIEAQHGEAEDWAKKPVQYASYVRGVAAVRKRTGWAIVGHKEHQPGDKPDPEFNMDQFRRDVTAAMNGDDVLDNNDVANTLVKTPVFPYSAPKDSLGTTWDETRKSAAAAKTGVADLKADMAELKASVAELKARPAGGTATVDPEALKVVILAPDVLAALAKAINDDAARRLAA